MIDQQIVSDLKNDPVELILGWTHSDVPRVMWEWLSINHPEILLECLNDPAIEFAPQSDLALAIHEVVNPGQLFMTEAVALLQGRYLLIRHFFMDPTRAMVCELECGRSHDPTAFKMTSVYPEVDGLCPPDTIEGYMIPYAKDVILQGRFVEMRGPFSAVITNVRTGGDRILRGEGLALTAASGEPPSAYPFLLLQGGVGLAPGVYEENDLRQNQMMWSLLEPVLRRGIIDWKPDRELTPMCTIR